MTPYYQDSLVALLQGDVRDALASLPDGSVHVCITSPPYWALRDYKTEGQVWGGSPDCPHEWAEGQRPASLLGAGGNTNGTYRGGVVNPGKVYALEEAPTAGGVCGLCGAWRGGLGLEPTPEMYVAHMVEVFRAVRRVLRDDGMMFLNLGDSYAGSWGNYAPGGITGTQRPQTKEGQRWERPAYHDTTFRPATASPGSGLKPLDLCNIPHRVAQALQADGWYWRQTWHWIKRSPMPESVRGTRWQRCRVKVAPVVEETHTSQKNRQRDGIGTGWSPAHPEKGDQPSTATWAACPGCPRCTYPERPERNGWVLRRGSWRYTDAVEYVFLMAKAPGYTAFQEQVREEHVDLGVPRAFGKVATREIGSVYGAEPNGGRNPRNWALLSSKPMDVSRCQGCGKVYLGYEFKRLPVSEVEVWDEEAEEYETKKVRQCKACGSWEWGSHYACFPTALVEPFIRAATSDKGVCPTCGAQWVPVVEQGDLKEHPGRQGRSDRNVGDYDGTGYSENGGTLGPVRDTTVLDYWPSCVCPAAPPTPAIVLDPFVGSGTACLAARTLGRRSIGIDLSIDYLDIAVKRLGDGRKAQMEMSL